MTLGEEPVHQSDGSHYGIQVGRTHNNPKVYCRIQSEDEVTVNGIPTHQTCESHCDIQACHTHNKFQVHWLWLTPEN